MNPPGAYALRSNANPDELLCRGDNEGERVFLLFTDVLKAGEFLGGHGMSSDEWWPVFLPERELLGVLAALEDEGVGWLRIDPPSLPFEQYAVTDIGKARKSLERWLVHAR